MFSKTELLWKQTPISTVLLGISFGVSSKGPLPPGSPRSSHRERFSVCRAVLHSYFKVSCISDPFQVPQQPRSTGFRAADTQLKDSHLNSTDTEVLFTRNVVIIIIIVSPLAAEAVSII